MIPFQLHRHIPLVRRPFHQRDQAMRERDALAAERDAALAERDALRAATQTPQADHESASKDAAACADHINLSGAVLQYRQAYFEARGHVAPYPALPTTRPWPRKDSGISYAEKLLALLDLRNGKGVEIGPLNIPLVSKLDVPNVLYVDHLDTDGIKAKYPTLSGIVEIDRPMINDSLKDTLQADAPLDYIVASQVFEHVANPIGWLRDIASVLRKGGLLSLSLPDRRMTFDLLREDSHPSDLVAAFLEDIDSPNIRSVYDHHSLASFVNMTWASSASVSPEDVVAGRGAVAPKRATDTHLALVERAKGGEYLDVHAWVFTPPSYLLVMAQLARDGFLPYRLHQFYPTNVNITDRGNSSFAIILEKTEGIPAEALRRSYLEPLGG